MTRVRHDTVMFDDRAYTFDATPIYEGWDVVVYAPDRKEPLVAFEFWRDGLRGPLADPTLGGLAREIMELLLPPAKLRHATPETFEREVRVYAANRRRAITPAELELMGRLVRQATHGDAFPTTKAATKAADEIASLMGLARATEIDHGTLEGAVLRGVLARAKLAVKKPISTRDLRVLARLQPGPFELPRGRDDAGLVPWSTAMNALRERGVIP
jgi:hypothetical protein